MNKRLRLPLALALALGSSSAFGLGLGQIEVKSALNEPLAAEIPVISSVPGEAGALKVRLAPPEALARVGLAAPVGVAANLQFALDTDPRGRTTIKVTTPGNVDEPFVTFLLEVDWGKGRILREYTLLLDPPTMAPVRGAPAATRPISEPEAFAPEPLAEEPMPTPLEPVPAPPAMVPPQQPAEVAAPVEAPRAPAPEETAPAPTPSAATILPQNLDAVPGSVSYGPVASGETLWSIAERMRPDASVTMNQMMLALLYANPDAFIDQNINRLKRGAVLRIPGRDEALNVAAVDAAALVREQTEAWRQKFDTVAQPAEPESISASRPPTATGTRPAPDSRLELVPPRGETTSASGAQSGASVDGGGRELRAELARAREEVNTLNQENVELKSRVDDLEKTQGDSERLISLQDSELAAAQKRLAELEARLALSESQPATDALATAPDEVVTSGPDVSPEPGSMTLEDPLAGVDSGTAADALGPIDSAPQEQAPLETLDDTVETPVSEPVAIEPESPPATVVAPPAKPAATPWYRNVWVLGGGGLVLVGLIALVLARRKSATSTVAPRYRSEDVASSIAAAKGAAVAPGGAETETDEVEADLIETVAMEPANLSAHLDLVRHYYERNDAASFEQAAEAMYARVYDPEDMSWKQAVAMGQEMAPDHPLFVAARASETDSLDDSAEQQAADDVDWGQVSPARADSGSTQPMSLDDLNAQLAQSRQSEPEPESEPEPAPAPAPAPKPAARTSGPDATSAPREAPSVPAPMDDGGLDGDDAASTKLELARAYLDMGDVEGARGMLEEVVGEGNPGQRAEAKRLLDEIR